MSANGTPSPEELVISVWWDNDKQSFRYQLTNVKNVEFGLGILGMVQEDIKFNLNIQRAKNMQQKAAQEMQEAYLKSQLHLGK